MENLCDDVRPAEQEVIPAVRDLELPRPHLLLSLREKLPLSPIVELPDNPVLWKLGCISERRTGAVLAKSRGIDHHTMRRKVPQMTVCYSRGARETDMDL